MKVRSHEIGGSHTQNLEPHPAIVFLQALDDRDDATFNIEHYTDLPTGAKKPSPDPLAARHPSLKLQEVRDLIPTLEQINSKGAGIFVAVNQCCGHRSKDSIVRVRGVHADMDDVSPEQLAEITSRLEPSIVVQSSSTARRQLYWLLADHHQIDVDTAEGVNRQLVTLGADKAATDASRLLRLPGFRHMKYRDRGETPLVTAEINIYRYTPKQIQAAFPPIPKEAARPQKPASANSFEPLMIAPDVVAHVVDAIKTTHPDLWAGHWDQALSKATGRPFESQSSADIALAGHIGRECCRAGITEEKLFDATLQVFSMSGLAQREKWKVRPDYRMGTIGTAIQGCTPTTSWASLSLPLDSYGDVRNAKAFAYKYQGKLLFITSRKAWLHWSGARWELCVKEEEVSYAKELCAEMLHQTVTVFKGDQDKGKKLVQDAMALHNLPKITAMLSLAVSEPGMAATEGELDADPMLLGVQNGVVDLKTGHHLINHPEMFITRFCDAKYAEGAGCPKWLKFLADVFQGDRETIDSVQRLLGYTLTGWSTEEILVICFGFGSNGKSVFNNVVQKIFGGYARMAPSSLLTVRRADDTGPRNDIASLAGARYVSVNELQAGDRLDEQVVKLLAGRETISARFLHREHFEFDPTFTAWLRTNHKPIITGQDDGIWRRLVPIPFRRKFEDHEKDPHLEEALLAERDGILQWMLEGTRKYLQDGLKLSATIRAEHAGYRKASDLLGEFLDDRTTASPAGKVEQGTLFFSWTVWCASNGVRHCSKKTFTQRLAERGYTEVKSNGNRYYSGLTALP